jgi:hypothetical protein
MLCVKYSVNPSGIVGAGQGLFVRETVSAGRVIIAPSHIQQTVSLQEILSHPDHPMSDSSIRWFEDYCTVSPDWPDECYVNHAFKPSGLWHLGFIFAGRDLLPGEEITVDYRHLIGPGVVMSFRDSVTQKEIVGYTWQKSLQRSTEQLLELVSAGVPEPELNV